ncbi:hypothetical protein ACFL5Z_17550 [Planctomycetota bacterium]
MVSRDRETKIAEVRKNNPDYVEAYIAMIDSPDHMDTLMKGHKAAMEKLLGYSIDEYDAEKHSRYVVFQMAEVIVPRALFREILERIGRLRVSIESAGTG